MTSTKRFLLTAAILAGAAITAYAVTHRRTFPGAVIAPQAAANARPPAATLDVTYIANQGVLIAAGATQVLIDGLHRPYQPSYPFLPEPYREQIETAQAPFNDIDVILVSHRHLDHFHPESVVRHLRHNTAARLVSSEQVVSEMRTVAEFGAVSSRVTTMTPQLRQRMSTTAAGVPIELLGVGHGTGRHATIQNLGHIVRLGGKNLLHIGDATTGDASIFEAFNLDDTGIDVAFLPNWFLTDDDGAAIVRHHIKPKHIVAVHMPPAGEAATVVGQIKKRFPDAVPFTRLLEKTFY